MNEEELAELAVKALISARRDEADEEHFAEIIKELSQGFIDNTLNLEAFFSQFAHLVKDNKELFD